jgi:HEPN domain-containing protein
MSNTDKESLRWYLQGRRDARTAGRNSANGDFEVACFLYQQAAEKILKSYLYHSGENPVLGHSTLKLAERAARFDAAFRGVLDACRDLDVFYVTTRYPNGIPDGAPFEFFRLHHAEKARHAFDEVHRVVHAGLGALAPDAEES